MVFKRINSRCQVGLIDIHSPADEEFKFILTYEDDLTKGHTISPAKYERSRRGLCCFFALFASFGAPSFLQNGIRSKFTNRIVEQFCSVWNKLKIYHGKPKHSRT
jgi:hypothetical protein